MTPTPDPIAAAEERAREAVIRALTESELGASAACADVRSASVLDEIEQAADEVIAAYRAALAEQGLVIVPREAANSFTNGDEIMKTREATPSEALYRHYGANAPSVCPPPSPRRGR